MFASQILKRRSWNGITTPNRINAPARQRYSLPLPNSPSQPRQPMSLPTSCRQIRLISGRAWVSLNGLDYILESGDELRLNGRHKAVISGLGNEAVIFEAAA